MEDKGGTKFEVIFLYTFTLFRFIEGTGIWRGRQSGQREEKVPYTSSEIIKHKDERRVRVGVEVNK